MPEELGFSPPHQYSSRDAISAFKAAGLEAEEVGAVPLNKPDGVSHLAVGGTRFAMPSLSPGRGGRVLAFDQPARLQEVRSHYERRTLTWTFVHGNLLLVLPGTLPQGRATHYQAALRLLESSDARNDSPQTRPTSRRPSAGVIAALSAVGILGVMLAAAGARSEEYPPLFGAWILLLPVAIAAGWLWLRSTGSWSRKRRGLVGLGVSVASLTALIFATAEVNPCDKRGRGVVLRNCDLAGEDLRTQNLAGADLSGANLIGARMAGATLDGARLAGTRMDRADLSGARLVRASLNNATLSGSKASGADFTEADLSDATLTASDLSDAQLTRASLRGVSLADASMTGANMASAVLSRANLEKSRLQGASLADAELTGAHLVGADLSDARLAGLKGERSVMRHAALIGADMTRARIGDSDLTAARLDGANLTGADLTGVNLTETVMSKTVLDSAVLVNAQGITNGMLASAFSVTEPSVSRSLAVKSTVIDRPETIESAAGAACRGSGVPSAPAYSGSPEFHALVVLDVEGNPSGPVEAIRSMARTAKWGAAGIRFAELVACIENPKWVHVERCGPYIKRSTGVRGAFTREQIGRRVRLVSTLTGQQVAEHTFLGPAPRACAQTEFAYDVPGQTEFTIRGDEVPLDNDITTWLAGFVRA